MNPKTYPVQRVETLAKVLPAVLDKNLSRVSASANDTFSEFTKSWPNFS